GRLEILSAAERHTILQEWNATGHALPAATLPQLFAAQAAARPDAAAVVFAHEQLSSGELEARANRPAHHPRARGPGADGAGGGSGPGARAGAGGFAPRYAQGRRRLSAARPRLPARAAELHAGGCRGGGAAHALGAARPGGRAQRAAAGA